MPLKVWAPYFGLKGKSAAGKVTRETSELMLPSASRWNSRALRPTGLPERMLDGLTMKSKATLMAKNGSGLREKIPGGRAARRRCDSRRRAGPAVRSAAASTSHAALQKAA